MIARPGRQPEDTTAAEHGLNDLTQAVLRMYQEVRASGNHEVAYHLLAAAGHAAQDLRDEDTLRRIAELARDHQRWLSANAPHHNLSETASRERGHSGLFGQLAVICDGMRLCVEGKHQIQRAQIINDSL